MSSREDPTWPFATERAADPDRAATPASEPTGPLFDALDAPLPSELERAELERAERDRRSEARPEGDVSVGAASPSRLQPGSRERATRPERTDVVPRREWRPREDRKSARPVRPRPGMRRVRRTIKHIDPISVLKISLFFYAIFFLFWLLLAAILYWFVQSLGWIDAVQTVADVILGENVEITLGLVERYAFIIGLAIAFVGSFANLVIAFLYNVASDLFGGIQITFSERDN